MEVCEQGRRRKTLRTYLVSFAVWEGGRRRTRSSVVQAYNKDEARDMVYAGVKTGCKLCPFQFVVCRFYNNGKVK